MARNVVHVDAPPEAVFDVLDNGWCYAEWVVGAGRIRDVDADWPAVGSNVHHQVGSRIPGIGLADCTSVVERDRPRRIVLQARALPFGVALVVMEMEPEGSGTRVTMTETPIRPTPVRLARRVLDPLVHLRNKEGLRRFKSLAERGVPAA